METEEYYRQLQAINQALEDCPEEERSDLLSLKQNIEELLYLTTEVEKHSNIRSAEDPIEVPVQEVEQENTTEIDNEYALFMAEMAQEGAVEVSTKVSNGSLTNPKKKKNETTSGKKSSKSLKHLEGKKFRAPHKHQWGQVVYHNAMVCSVPDEIPFDNEFQVKILFLNPTHKEMLPCPYYFHLEKNCNFEEGQCGYSHGEFVPFSSLQEYIEPKFELLTIGSDVLAMQSNSLWYRAKITQIFKDRSKCLVKFDSKNVENQSFEEVPFPHILPLEVVQTISDDDSDNDSDVEVVEVDFEAQLAKDRQELIDASLMNTPESQQLGDWEKYTKGIGSKLMQKMGYIVGTGLGKQGSGIIKPVTAMILPQGKSLDYCMNLKEKQNNPDLFSADRRATKPGKKALRKSRKSEKAAKVSARQQKRLQRMDVAKFIKYRFAITTTHWNRKDQQEHDLLRDKLKTGSDKAVNTANFIIEEKIKQHTAIIEGIKLSITRLEAVHCDTKKLQRQLRDQEDHLKNCDTYKTMIGYEIFRRKNNKEMAVF